MCTGEWVDTTLAEVIDSYPEMYYWDLVIMESDADDAELYYLGEIDTIFNECKDYKVFYTDADSEQVQLEGELSSLDDMKPGEWKW